MSPEHPYPSLLGLGMVSYPKGGFPTFNPNIIVESMTCIRWWVVWKDLVWYWLFEQILLQNSELYKVYQPYVLINALVTK